MDLRDLAGDVGGEIGWFGRLGEKGRRKSKECDDGEKALHRLTIAERARVLQNWRFLG